MHIYQPKEIWIKIHLKSCIQIPKSVIIISNFTGIFVFVFLKAFNKANGVYTSLIIAIFDIWFNAGHLVCNALRSEFYYFSTKLYQWFCYACTHAPAVYRYIGWGSLIHHSTHNAFFLLLRFVNLTRLDLKENVLFFFTNWDIITECSQL